MVIFSEYEFFSLYLPAVVKSLNHDPNSAEHIYGPESFLDQSLHKQIDYFIDNDNRNQTFYNMIAYYFDATSHGFDRIGNTHIVDYKTQILKKVQDIKMWYDIKNF